MLVGAIPARRVASINGMEKGPGFEGWLFIPADAVPERWKDRAVLVAAVPMLTNEVEELLAGRAPVPELDGLEERLAKLLARGSTIKRIAKDVSLSTRSVERHLSRLCDRFDMSSTRELAIFFARHGLY